MKHLLTTTIVVILFSINSIGQSLVIPKITTKLHLKEQIVSLSLIFISGATDGMADYLQFHYNGNSQFWQPDISWTNKYKHHNPSEGRAYVGSRTWLVFTTDGWHMSKFVRDVTMSGAIAFKIPLLGRKNWKHILVDGLLYLATNRLGFLSTYYTLNIK